MKYTPRKIGDRHVVAVYSALVDLTQGLTIDDHPPTAISTASYIYNLVPGITSVTSKFNSSNSNTAKDLTLTLENGETKSVNLFLIRKGGTIQPKNPGAGSFLSKYFLSEESQQKFNQEFENYYKLFLKDLISNKEESVYITDKRRLKQIVSSHYPKFTEDINPLRNKFLFSLREACFSILQEFYNEKSEGLYHAFETFFMLNDINIVTSYGKKEGDVWVEEFNPGTPRFDNMEVYKTGISTVGIKFGEIALTLRFKFESSPVSSIKLAASYQVFPEETEIIKANGKTLSRLDELMAQHQYQEEKNTSNSIGKCHEVFTYYYFLKEQPRIFQVEPDDSINQLAKYYSRLKPETLKKLHASTSTVTFAINQKLSEKYGNYSIQSIELIPDSYLANPLNTGDLQLVLKVNGLSIEEAVSLKAAARKSSKITTKNPGIGTILGPTYFDAGSMNTLVSETRDKYESGELSHAASLVRISHGLGNQLELASQIQLKKGIESLLGSVLVAITFYEDGESYCKEPSNINSQIVVEKAFPSKTQNTLVWEEGAEAISLRVKFSRGQSHGWSTVKIAAEYQLAP